jgi:superfamily II DNA or RNA helicase
VSKSFDCLSGYFSSKVISELAEPLSVLFKNPNAKGRFIISPNLDEDDKDALLEAYRNEESIFNYLLVNGELSSDTLMSATLDVMKFLISTKRLDIRIVVMKEGMMHAKIWIFDTTFGKVAIHGSGNATGSGLMRNFEQLVFSRTWESKNSKIIVDAYELRFESFWASQRDDSFTLRLNDKTLFDIFSSTNTSIERTDVSQLLKRLEIYMKDNLTRNKLVIPDWLKYREGDYKHQGEAVDKWMENNKKGVLEIATGGGKTLTSLICASLAFSHSDIGILVISVPTKPLIKQWADDVRKFLIEPIDTEGMGTKNIVRNIRRIIKQHEVIRQHTVIIMTHDALKTNEVKEVLNKYDGPQMLIGDEAHNLGVSKFADNPPLSFNYRLGLSATPERQYDSEGTLKLLKYFGGIVFEYPLEQAIGSCLVPFEYHPHKVYLTTEEADEWKEYTAKINSLSWSKDAETKKYVEQLQIRRRAISEGALEKIYEFRTEIRKLQDRKYSLAFCTDKSPNQLQEVNKILQIEGFTFHQVTGDETASQSLVHTIVDSYKRGDIEILTSKRVLDEGFNIPPIKTAYFLASSGTTRTWVQRLGRVLRKSDDTGKIYAVVHDFIVLPSEQSILFKSLISGELKRMQWFMSLAKNGMELDGSIALSNKLISMLEEL